MSGDRIDHAAEARRLLREKPPGKGYWSHAEGATHSVLCGIGHALMAIHEALVPPPPDPPHTRPYPMVTWSLWGVWP